MTGARAGDPPELFRSRGAQALFDLTREKGYEAVRVGDIVEEGAISRETFDRHFTGKTDFTLRVFDAYTDDYKDRTSRAFRSLPTWPDNLRAAAYETARWVQEYPDGVWFGMIGVLSAPGMVLVAREETFKWGVAMIDAGRQLAPDPAAVPFAAPLMAVGAIVETLRRQQEGTLEEDIIAVVPQLMAATVRPYLGEEAALRELRIPPPPDL